MHLTLVSGKARKAAITLFAVICLVGCGSPAGISPLPSPSNPDLVGGGLSGGAVSESEWDALVTAALPSVVKVSVKGCGFSGTASGFSVGSWIVTNRHVVEDAKSLSFLDAKKKRHKVTDWRFSDKDDLALLSIDSGLIPKLKVSLSDGISGDLVATGGYPLGGVQVSNHGRLVSKTEDFNDGGSSGSFVWRTTAEILPGDSGGPMLDKHGSVIGVMFALDLIQGYTLAIPVSRLNAILQDTTLTSEGKPCS